MKRFWKKGNRGLMLGLVLLLGLIGFIAVKEVQFRQEVPEIRETVEDYFSAMAEYNLLTAEDPCGEVLGEAEQEARLAEWEDVMEDYWYSKADSRDVQSYLNNAGQCYEYARLWLAGPSYVNVREAESIVTKGDIHVTRDGPGFATVEVRKCRWEVVYRGNVSAIFSGLGFADDSVEGKEQWHRATLESDYLTFQLQRTGDGWKIIGASDINFYCAFDTQV